MTVLVDGNNLTYAACELEDPERPIGRWALCETLREWARRSRNKVHVVFDGPDPPGDFKRQLADGQFVEVSFSGPGRTADAVLIEMLNENSAARRMLVVSSDREIRRAAKRRRAKDVRSDEFWMAVRSMLQRPERRSSEPGEKRVGLADDEADEWMTLFGLDEDAG